MFLQYTGARLAPLPQLPPPLLGCLSTAFLTPHPGACAVPATLQSTQRATRLQSSLGAASVALLLALEGTLLRPRALLDSPPLLDRPALLHGPALLDRPALLDGSALLNGPALLDRPLLPLDCLVVLHHPTLLDCPSLWDRLPWD